MNLDLEINNWLTCRKDYYDHDTIYTSPIVFYKDRKYKIWDFDHTAIQILTDTGNAPKSIYVFYLEDDNINYWKKWFYTKQEMRNQKLKELGIV